MYLEVAQKMKYVYDHVIQIKKDSTIEMQGKGLAKGESCHYDCCDQAIFLNSRRVLEFKICQLIMLGTIQPLVSSSQLSQGEHGKEGGEGVMLQYAPESVL